LCILNDDLAHGFNVMEREEFGECELPTFRRVQ
jgi:hypothetical protein